MSCDIHNITSGCGNSKIAEDFYLLNILFRLGFGFGFGFRLGFGLGFGFRFGFRLWFRLWFWLGVTIRSENQSIIIHSKCLPGYVKYGRICSVNRSGNLLLCGLDHYRNITHYLIKYHSGSIING